MKIVLAEPRGFCAGVERAMRMLRDILASDPGRPLYLLHAVVHNQSVTRFTLDSGGRIVASVSEIPPGERLLISAHGAAQRVFDEAAARGLEVIDATCPLVRSVQKKAAALTASGRTVLLFGNASHREVEGILGHCTPDSCIVLDGIEAAERFLPRTGTKYAALSQTTWNADDVARMTGILRRKIPDLELSGTVCTATSERQNAVRRLAAECDAVLVVGSETSSNTMRLLEIAGENGRRAYLVPDASFLTPEMTAGVSVLGIASGASTGDDDIRSVLRRLECR